MLEFTKEEAETFLKKVEVGDYEAVSSILKPFDAGKGGARYMFRTFTDGVFDDAARLAAMNGHLDILKRIYTYGKVSKDDIIKIIIKRQWPVLEWLKTQCVMPSPQLPELLAVALARIQDQEERENAIAYLKAVFSEDFTEDYMQELSDELEDQLDYRNLRQRKGLKWDDSD